MTWADVPWGVAGALVVALAALTGIYWLWFVGPR